MSMHRFVVAIVLACISFGTSSAQETIAAWDLFRQSGDQEFTPASESSLGVTGIDMVRGGGLNPTAGNNSFNSNGWALNGPDTDTEVNEDAFVEIGFDTDIDIAVDLAELVIGSRSSGSGPSEIGIFTSLDDFTEPFATIEQFGSSFANTTIDISDLGIVTGEFRMRFMNVGGDTTADRDRIGDMDEQSTWRITDFRSEEGQFSDTRLTGALVAIEPMQCMPVNALLGDLDGNGTVEFLDFLELADNFGQEGTYEEGDINCNGTVEFLDFLELAENFGKTLEDVAAAAVPEPSALSLMLSTLFLGCLVRRKRV